MEYCIDNKQNIINQGNAVLENLTEGAHQLTVHVEGNNNLTYTYKTVYFTINKTKTTEIEPELNTTEQSNTTNQQATTQQTETQSQLIEDTQSPITNTELVIITITAASIVGATSLWVSKKRKNNSDLGI